MAEVAILMYHRINDGLPEGELVVSSEKFRQQIEYLKDHGQVISLADVVNIISNGPGGTHLKLPVAITIDDGYRDNYLNAFPILQQFDLPAAGSAQA